MDQRAEKRRIAEEDVLRADVYDLLSALLAKPPTKDLIARLRGLEGDATPLGRAIAALAKVASTVNETATEREFNRLFIGVGRGEVLPYASYYMTGFLNEKPLAALRQDMARHGMERAEGVFEPEDNVASLCEMMAGLIRGRFDAPAGLGQQREFFNRHLAPWAGHFFTDLEGAKGAFLYAPVGAIGRQFVSIEKEAFKLSGASAA